MFFFCVHRLCSKLTPCLTTQVAHFHEHKAKIDKAIPKEQLLYFNVKQGWAPLEKFLDVKAPKGVPFPRINEAEGLKAIEIFLLVVSIAWPLIVGIIGLVLVIVFRKLTDPCFKPRSAAHLKA